VVSLHSPGWPKIFHLPASASQVLGLQACTTTTVLQISLFLLFPLLDYKLLTIGPVFLYCFFLRCLAYCKTNSTHT
jgi:hypothetical protein